MPDETVEQIRERMIRIRTRANRKASRLGEETRRLLDWRYYVRQFPWGAVAAAAVGGYLAVPRRRASAVPSVGQPVVVIPPEASRRSERGGLVSLASRMALNLAVRTGLAYGGQMLGRILSHSQPQSPSEELDREYSSSVR